ncbi:UNVERIFIED_CONTAM: hypothetical protein GTU68_057017 [Idotea baltica]|nr:hypothetical protein [Idotea baltica]
MKPFEILLSESQERMLLVVEKGSEQRFYDIFDKWDLECQHIGQVTDTKHIRYYQNGELVADVPAEDLVLGGGAPVYQREFTKPAYLAKIEAFNADVPEPEDYLIAMNHLISSPNIASKKWIYEQYDNTVRTNTVSNTERSDASIIRLKNSDQGLVVTTDCNSSYVYSNPRIGAQIAVSEAARNIVCSGGKPMAITNCLNFGNPYNPEVFYQFKEAITGMGEACRHYNTPVTGGNVSFYNQSVINNTVVPVYPTPTIGMLGLIADINDRISLDFKQPGDVLLVLGRLPQRWTTSEYLRNFQDIDYAPVPDHSLSEESLLHEAIYSLNDGKMIQSAHDVSEGGLFIALVESGLAGGLGFDIRSSEHIRKDMYLFNEDQGRIVISIKVEILSQVTELLDQIGVIYNQIGTVTSQSCIIDGTHYKNVNEWRPLYDQSLSRIFEGQKPIS